MAIDNPSFEDAGPTQGTAAEWGLLATPGATGVPAITAIDGNTYATEDFGGWSTGLDEYRFNGFEDGDVVEAPVEHFTAWTSSLDDYRSAFIGGDLVEAPVESFDLWIAGLDEYRAAPEPGDTVAAPVEDFDLWTADLAEYRAAFDPGDTDTPVINAGPGAGGDTENFSACRADVAVQATASSSTVAAAGHTFEVGDPALLLADGSLFGPFQKGIVYFVESTVPGVSLTLVEAEFDPPIEATASGEATLIGDPAVFWRNPKTAW